MILDEGAYKSGGVMTTSTIREFFEKLENELKEASVPPDSEFAVKFSHPALSSIREAIRALRGLEVGDKPHKAFVRQKLGSAALSLDQANQDDWLLEQVDEVKVRKGYQNRSKAEAEVAASLRKVGIERKGKTITAKKLADLRWRRDRRNIEKNPRVTFSDKSVD